MAEGAIQPDIDQDHTNEPGHTTSEKTTSNVEETSQAASTGSRPMVIWTPRFIVIFVLTLVIGLSIESLLTQGWLNHLYTGQWVFQAHVILIFFCWLALAVRTRTGWVRIGSILGCIWALFMTLNITISALDVDPSSPVLFYLNATICIALLGSYLCLSINKTPFSRLDAWLFGLAPITGSIAVVLIYFLTPSYERSLNNLESAIATIALVLSLLVWWIRPTSWKAQPGPTFLFGSVPLLLLLLAIPSMGYNESNFFLAHVVLYPMSNPLNNEQDFFLSQVALLSLILGTIRLLFSELRN